MLLLQNENGLTCKEISKSSGNFFHNHGVPFINLGFEKGNIKMELVAVEFQNKIEREKYKKK